MIRVGVTMITAIPKEVRVAKKVELIGETIIKEGNTMITGPAGTQNAQEDRAPWANSHHRRGVCRWWLIQFGKASLRPKAAFRGSSIPRETLKDLQNRVRSYNLVLRG